jgi:2-keto-4-pentenoate hydratase/2-oxohepta-3-ene-1,7-dioic acid hydratase in catechol pathway
MKIICIGRNYAAHAQELNNEIPEQPVLFMKPPSALLINDKPFYYPAFSKNIHYELELVLKIGKNGRHIQPEFADEYVQEIGLGIDFTARDLQDRCKQKGQPWEIAKAFDSSAVLGQFVETKSLSLDNIRFYLTKNGEKVQEGSSKNMIFNFNELICYTSQFFKIQMGDYMFTGTPSGVGPIQIGDLLEGFLEIKGEAKKKCFIVKLDSFGMFSYLTEHLVILK